MGWFTKSIHDKQCDALTKILVNLFETTTDIARADHAPIVLKFERQDSRFFYLNFCFGTAFFFSAESMKEAEAVLIECQRKLVDFAFSYRGPDPLLSKPVDRQRAATESEAFLEDCIKRWSHYLTLLEARAAAGLKGPSAETTTTVCAMLRDTEATAALTAEDKQRLWPLASWIESTIASIEPAFVALVNGTVRQR